MNARPYVLHETNYQQLQVHRPNLAVLPWGATEAHNRHLPHGTDVIEGTALADARINVQNITTSEIKISRIINKADGHQALQLVHDAFELDKAK